MEYLCIDGPFSGRNLWLRSGGHTLAFSLYGFTGRYVPAGSASFLSFVDQVRWESRA